ADPLDSITIEKHHTLGHLILRPTKGHPQAVIEVLAQEQQYVGDHLLLEYRAGKLTVCEGLAQALLSTQSAGIRDHLVEYLLLSPTPRPVVGEHHHATTGALIRGCGW